MNCVPRSTATGLHSARAIPARRRSTGAWRRGWCRNPGSGRTGIRPAAIFFRPCRCRGACGAAGRLEFFDALRVGDGVERQSKIADVNVKEGRSGRLVFVAVDHEISTPRGLAMKERHDIVYRDAASREAKPAAPSAAEPLRKAQWSATKAADAVMLFRYSALTFNGHRIHYDWRYVTEVEGYPSLIVHGPLQATLLIEFAASIRGAALGESLVGDGNEVAHIDLIIGSKSGRRATAFCNALTNNKDGFTTLLAVVAPNLPAKPDTILFNKVTIKGAKQAVQMFGPAQAAVARAVVDSVESGVIRRTRPTTTASWSACSSTGTRPTTRRSTTTTTRRPRNRSSAL
jgi:hypothetical protein